MPKKRKLPESDIINAIDRAASLYFDSVMPGVRRAIASQPAKVNPSLPLGEPMPKLTHFLAASANHRRPFLERACGLDASAVERYIQSRFGVQPRGIENELADLGDGICYGELKAGNETAELARLIREKKIPR